MLSFCCNFFGCFYHRNCTALSFLTLSFLLYIFLLITSGPLFNALLYNCSTVDFKFAEIFKFESHCVHWPTAQNPFVTKLRKVSSMDDMGLKQCHLYMYSFRRTILSKGRRQLLNEIHVILHCGQ
jgi:hypothetical protein